MVADADCRRLTPLHAAGWLVNKCARPIERLGRCSDLPRGVSSEAEFLPRRGLAEGSAEGASSEAEIASATRGLGRDPLSKAELMLRLVRPRKSRTVVLCRGPSVRFGLLTPEGDLGL